MKKEFILYHASVESFSEFKEEKIREYESDAPFNGFWFSSDKNTSCAWVNPNYLKTCKIVLKNPCSWDIIKELLINSPNGYTCSELRKKLIELGYDGIVFEDKPIINREELTNKGETKFITTRGFEYKLKKDEDYNGIDLYDAHDECITGYSSLEDFLNQQEIIVTTFSNENIEILKEEKNPYW